MAGELEAEMARLGQAARMVGLETVPDVMRRVRDEMADMLLRVADRETGEDGKRVAARLREIAGRLREVKL